MIDKWKKRVVDLEVKLWSIAPYARLMDLMFQEKDQGYLEGEAEREAKRLWDWWSNLDSFQQTQIRDWARQNSYDTEKAIDRIYNRQFSNEREFSPI